MADFFPHAEGVGQELFLLLIYIYFIFQGSKAIAEGCDVLRDVFGAGIVGGLVLPVIGAAPDGIIVIFSLTAGGESPAEIAESIAVGIGSLIGASVLLISLPLAISIFLGSRQLDENGVAMSEYKPIAKGSSKLVLRPVVPTKFSLWSNGITTLPNTPRSVIWMLLTSLTYLSVQIPAVFYHTNADQGAKNEHAFLLFGTIAAIILFVCYLKAMSSDADNDDLVEERRQRGSRFLAWTRENRSLISSIDPVTLFNLLDTDNDGLLDALDIEQGFKLLGFTDISNADALAIFNLADQDNNILIDLDEWTAFVREFILLNEQQPHRGRREKEMLNKSTLNGEDNNNSSGSNLFTDSNPDAIRLQPIMLDPMASASGTTGNIQMNTNQQFNSGRESGGEYATPSYIDETNRLWFNNNNNNASPSKPMPVSSSRMNVTSTSPGVENHSTPLIATAESPFRQSMNYPNYTGLAGSYRGSTNGIPGFNAGRQGVAPIEKPKFIRLESSASLLQQSHAQQPLTASPSAVSGAFTHHQSDLGMSIANLRQTNPRTDLYTDYNTSNKDEASEVLFLDPNRIEEDIDPSIKQIPPPIPPECMAKILKWFLDTKTTKVGLLYIGNRLRWAVHLWAKRTRKLGHYSLTTETGERVLKLVKLDQAAQLPLHHNRKRTTSFAVTKDGHQALDMRSSRAGGGVGDSDHNTSPRHHNTFFDPQSAVYHQNEWEDLNMPRWIYASPQIKAWYLSKMAEKGGDFALATPSIAEQTPVSPMNNNAEEEEDIGEDGNLLFSRKKKAVSFGINAIKSSSSSSSTQTINPAAIGDLPPLLELFQAADEEGTKVGITITNVLHFAERWGLYQGDITPNVIKVIYYNIDGDYDKVIDVFNFRLLLEEFVRLPQIGTKLLKRAAGSSKRNTPGRVYTDSEKKQWVEDIEDRQDELNGAESKALQTYCWVNLDCQAYISGSMELHKSEHDGEEGHAVAPHDMEAFKRKKILVGFGYLTLGMALIILFSDPMIEIVTKLGKSSGIPAFYISFILIPIVSNSAELMASIGFATERTSSSIALTLSSLYGAVILNNTLNTGIFFFLLWLKKMPWIYSAEVIVVITVQIIIGAITYRNNLRQVHAVVCALVFPLAIFGIWAIENIFGLKDW